MATKYNNKIIYGGEVLIDLTGDTVTADKILEGYTAHAGSGAPIEGTCKFDADTSDATALATEILSGATAYVNGKSVTGTMTNNEQFTGSITLKNQSVSIPEGYHDGTGNVGISAVEQNKLVSQNIREGITILGVTGSMSGSESEQQQSKTVTPTKSTQHFTPDTGYTCFSDFTVNPIPDKYVDGTTVTTTSADQILTGHSGYIYSASVNNGIPQLVSGTMANNGALTNTITTQGGTYNIPAGYTSGGTVVAQLNASELTNDIINGSTNVKQTGESIDSFSVSVTVPAGYHEEQTITKTFSDILPAIETDATATQILNGYQAYNENGVLVTGTMTNNGKVTQSLNTTTTSYTIAQGYHDGTGKVSITTETKTATPTKSQQTISPTSGKVLSSVTVDPIPAKYGDVSTTTATTANVLSGTTALGKDSSGNAIVLSGTMPNNGAQNITLDTVTTSQQIPAGYTSGGSASINVESKTATPTKDGLTITPTAGYVLSSVKINAIPYNETENAAGGITITIG